MFIIILNQIFEKGHSTQFVMNCQIKKIIKRRFRIYEDPGENTMKDGYRPWMFIFVQLLNSHCHITQLKRDNDKPLFAIFPEIGKFNWNTGVSVHYTFPHIPPFVSNDEVSLLSTPVAHSLEDVYFSVIFMLVHICV